MDLEKILQALNPEIIEKFKDALALGKWPDGRSLSVEQKEICMQAVIAYEQKYLPEHERTGYVPPKNSACDTTDHRHDDPDSANNTLTWVN